MTLTGMNREKRVRVRPRTAARVLADPRRVSVHPVTFRKVEASRKAVPRPVLVGALPRPVVNRKAVDRLGAADSLKATRTRASKAKAALPVVGAKAHPLAADSLKAAALPLAVVGGRVPRPVAAHLGASGNRVGEVSASPALVEPGNGAFRVFRPVSHGTRSPGSSQATVLFPVRLMVGHGPLTAVI